MTKPTKSWQCQKCGVFGKTIPREFPRSRLCAWCADDLARAGLRWCSACRSVQPADSVNRGHQCLPCRRARQAAWHAAHPGYNAAKSKERHAANPDERTARNRAAYAAKRATILAQKRVYYQANAERIRAAEQRRRDAGLSPASRAKARRRQQERRAIYKQNERIAWARRLAALVRWRGASPAQRGTP